ncbi:B31 [miniopterid betaherpesvirus 1]|uniref:B31 n=1 Tax=miniopterid betaherpesvirus 1 TaxID=3070189 RepID=I3VQ06_9BETA|nr:B31 [miniopterid betaherpesvirus 1]AFK83850.1 B31 [miniopterid betaherpesvirus 1]
MSLLELLQSESQDIDDTLSTLMDTSDFVNTTPNEPQQGNSTPQLTPQTPQTCQQQQNQRFIVLSQQPSQASSPFQSPDRAPPTPLSQYPNHSHPPQRFHAPDSAVSTHATPVAPSNAYPGDMNAIANAPRPCDVWAISAPHEIYRSITAMPDGLIVPVDTSGDKTKSAVGAVHDAVATDWNVDVPGWTDETAWSVEATVWNANMPIPEPEMSECNESYQIDDINLDADENAEETEHQIKKPRVDTSIAPTVATDPVSGSLSNFQETWFNTLKDINEENQGRAVATVKPTSVIRTPYIFEHQLHMMTSFYNELGSTVHRAICHQGCIVLKVPVLDNHFSDGALYSFAWCNVMLPTATDPAAIFLLASTADGDAVCQPAITRGSLQTVMMAYSRDVVRTPSPEIGSLSTSLIMIPFVPSGFISHTVKFLTVNEPNLQRTRVGKNIADAAVIQDNNGFIIITKGLSWELRRMILTDGRKRSQYTSWFLGNWPGSLNEGCTWRSCANTIYVYGNTTFRLNLDYIYILNTNRRTVLGCVSTSMHSRVVNEVSPKKLPTSCALRVEVCTETPGPDVVCFDRNPRIYFRGDPLDHHHTITNGLMWSTFSLMAPYDIHFAGERHVVRLCVRYSNLKKKMFLVTTPDGNNLFHTGMCVWKPNSPLRLTLWCHTKKLTITQGSVIATLYCIDTTDGDVTSYDDQTVFRYVERLGLRYGCVGNLRLMRTNFMYKGPL